MTETTYRLSGWQFTTRLLIIGGGLSVVIFVPTLYFIQSASNADMSLYLVIGTLLAISMLFILQMMLFRPITTQLTQVTMALDYLQRNQAVTEIPLSDNDALKPLIEVVNAMIREHNDLKTMRGQLVDQISAAAAQEERNRLARDLHDSIKQQVFSMSVSAAAAYAHLDSNLDASRKALIDVKRSAREAMVEMRVMLQQLSPAPLEKSGLIEALRQQCEALSYRTGATVDTHFDASLRDDRLPTGTQEALFRIAQEALSNIARHARAGHVLLALHSNEEALILTITDDGQGFDMNNDPIGMGLSNIQSRVKDLKATLNITSQINIGSELIVTIPFIQTPQKEIMMHNQYENQIKLITSQYFRFAGGIAVFIVAISLLLWRILQRPENIANDVVLFTIMIILIGTSIFAPIFAFWAWTQSRSQHTAVLISAGQHSTADYKLRRIQAMTGLIIALACAWFLPILALGLGVSSWFTVAIGALFLIISLWYYLRMGNLYHQEVILLSPEARITELDQQIVNTRKGVLTVIGLCAFVVFTSLMGDGIHLPPENPDHWMNIAFITASVLIVLNQFISVRTYTQWRNQDTKEKTPL